MMTLYGWYCFLTHATMYGQSNTESIGGMTAFMCGAPSPDAIVFAVFVDESVLPFVMLNVPPSLLR